MNKVLAQTCSELPAKLSNFRGVIIRVQFTLKDFDGDRFIAAIVGNFIVKNQTLRFLTRAELFEVNFFCRLPTSIMRVYK